MPSGTYSSYLSTVPKLKAVNSNERNDSTRKNENPVFQIHQLLYYNLFRAFLQNRSADSFLQKLFSSGFSSQTFLCTLFYTGFLCALFCIGLLCVLF